MAISFSANRKKQKQKQKNQNQKQKNQNQKQKNQNQKQKNQNQKQKHKLWVQVHVIIPYYFQLIQGGKGAAENTQYKFGGVTRYFQSPNGIKSKV